MSTLSEQVISLSYRYVSKGSKEISKPVTKDGSEHIEYVPSQVVSEYFALVFQPAKGKNLDGILYPSSVHSGGRNLVLFPSERTFEPIFDQVGFLSGWML
ncbi:RES family NAD+ phosphorylase [Methylovulum psychrotolerans]|uniref:RES domain-containing protein n=1 Tax=Methylovulum psychrotolerans TaxID=1704499 RepID=A0A1Z4BW07_9GAMM|nr:RES family NAD+ phosphorylase [Methylovulum psychrotolerans]ASF45484.1 hypothetical protein CEK71_05050 [Methylovulum psychrotolerans]